MKQKTISQEIKFSGFGVHSAKKSTIALKTSKIDSGIVFKALEQEIKVSLENIHQELEISLCTKLSKNNLIISTVEHILSALNGLNISNLIIEIEGQEIPILDGATNRFVTEIYPYIVKQEKEVSCLSLDKEIIYRLDDKFIIAIPHDSLEINYFIDYNKLPYFMFYKYKHSVENYIKDISKARTFGYLEDLDYLKKNNFALGSSLDNSLVINKNSYLNKPNYYNEPVRHKILDFIGDLTFLEQKINAKIFAFKTGHKDHLEFIKLIHKNLN